MNTCAECTYAKPENGRLRCTRIVDCYGGNDDETCIESGAVTSHQLGKLYVLPTFGCKRLGGPKLVSFHDVLKARFPDKPVEVSPEDLARFRASMLRLHDCLSSTTRTGTAAKWKPKTWSTPKKRGRVKCDEFVSRLVKVFMEFDSDTFYGPGFVSVAREVDPTRSAGLRFKP